MIIIALIVLVGLALRLADLDATHLWYDEAYSWEQASRPFWDMLVATAGDNYPPLHNLILHATILIFGDSETALRMPSVLLGTASVYLLYRLGTEMFDRQTGLIAALLLSVSVVHVWYSIEARMYALLGFTAILYAWTCIRALETDRWAAYLPCLISAVLLLYSHVFGSFTFVGVNIGVIAFCLRDGRAGFPRLGRWLLSQAGAAVLFLPWAVVLLLRVPVAETLIGWFPDVDVKTVNIILTELLNGRYMVWAIFLVILAGSLLARIAPVQAQAAVRPPRYALSLLVLYGWVLVPVGLALVISQIYTPIFWVRYFICILPAVFLLIALAVTESYRNLWLRGMAVALLVVPSMGRMDQIAMPSWRNTLEAEFQQYHQLVEPGDRLVTLLSRDPSFDYYAEDIPGLVRLQGEDSLADLSGIHRVWLVALNNPRAMHDPLVDRLREEGLVEIYSSDNPNVMFALFTRSGAVSHSEPSP